MYAKTDAFRAHAMPVLAHSVLFNMNEWMLCVCMCVQCGNIILMNVLSLALSVSIIKHISTGCNNFISSTTRVANSFFCISQCLSFAADFIVAQRIFANSINKIIQLKSDYHRIIEIEQCFVLCISADSTKYTSHLLLTFVWSRTYRDTHTHNHI